MKKRAVSFLLASLAVVSFILPALATEEPAGVVETPPAVEEAEPNPILLDGEPLSVEYEVRSGTTYVTVASFVSAVDPEVVVDEEDGVVTVSSAVMGRIEDDEGNTADLELETLSMTISAELPYIVANAGRMKLTTARVASKELTARFFMKSLLNLNLYSQHPIYRPFGIFGCDYRFLQFAFKL